MIFVLKVEDSWSLFVSNRKWNKGWVLIEFQFIRFMGGVGTPPHTWHTSPNDTWHTFSSGSASSEFPPRVHVARFSYPDSLKERHTTLTNITSGQLPQHIRTTDIHYPGMFVRIINWSKQVLHIIATACHGPRSATCRVKWQEWSDGKSLPTISDSRSNYHDLCQPPVGW